MSQKAHADPCHSALGIRRFFFGKNDSGIDEAPGLRYYYCAIPTVRQHRRNILVFAFIQYYMGMFVKLPFQFSESMPLSEAQY